MKSDLMAPWRIVAVALYAILALLVAAPYATVRGALTPAPRMPRVGCRNCGYRMPAIERHCPECRAAFRAEDA